jgi:amidophosphoribosyltransferase
LTVLQHRGQDAAGIVTSERRRLHLRKNNGLVRDVFQQRHMLELRGNVGIGHCRYPTAGSSSCAEAQPLYTNYPYGICVAHNGNLTNTNELASKLHNRHVNTDSDSEILLNLFANHLVTHDAPVPATNNTNGGSASASHADAVFSAMKEVMKECKGGYAGLYLINGLGLVGFRDPHGIRPIVFGCRKSRSTRYSDAGNTNGEFDNDGIPRTPTYMAAAEGRLDYVICSESVAIDTLGFERIRYARS